MTKTTLIEPSMLDVILAIERADDVPVQKRMHWCCSMRQICLYLNRALGDCPGPLVGHQ